MVEINIFMILFNHSSYSLKTTITKAQLIKD